VVPDCGLLGDATPVPGSEKQKMKSIGELIDAAVLTAARSKPKHTHRQLLDGMGGAYLDSTFGRNTHSMEWTS
jgi:hypothetical protein